MIHRICIITTLLILFMLTFNCSETETTEKMIGENLKYIQLINFNPKANESKMINMFDEFNQVIAELGYKNIKYQVWKVKSDKEGEKTYKYFIEVTWPDQKTYDMISNIKQYKELVEKYQETMAMSTADLYNDEYIPVN